MPEEVFETPQPVQIAEQKTTNWPKMILVAVLGLGLLATAAYAGYWYGTQEISNLKSQISKPQPKTQSQEEPTPTPTPTPAVEDETKDWETYTNSAYRFSFKYPSGWFFGGDSLEVGGGVSVLNYDMSKAPGREYVPELDKGKFKIELYVNKDHSDVSEWYELEKDRKSERTGEKMVHYNFKNTVVDDQPGVFYETEAFTNTRVGQAVFEVPSKDFLILIHGGLDYSGNQEYFDQILSTFKFLD